MSFDLIFTSPLDFLPYCLLGLMAMAEGPVAILIGGAATSGGFLLPLPVYFSVVMGNLTADMGWYTLGRFCKMDWLARLVAKIGVDPRRIAQLEQKVQQHAPRLLFLAKLTVGFPIPTLIATGLSRVPVHRWVGMLVLGELIKSAVLVSAGYLYAHALQQASANVQEILWGFTAVILTAGLFWYRHHQQKKAPRGAR